jgi:crotonobetainyl-CoA:carnitine CoA-transferase CaiB-like acyl-CoA transferase
MDHPETEPMTTHGEPITMSSVAPIVERAPLMGEHTEYVLKELLAVDEPAVDQLYVDGVLR